MGVKVTRDSKLRKKVRIYRIKKKLFGTADRPRLLFNKTLRYLYAQLIDDVNNKTLCSFSTLNNQKSDGTDHSYNFKNCNVALSFGKEIGIKLKEKGYNSIVFVRNGYLYHGKVKIFADSIREQGIDF